MRRLVWLCSATTDTVTNLLSRRHQMFMHFLVAVPGHDSDASDHNTRQRSRSKGKQALQVRDSNETNIEAEREKCRININEVKHMN